MIKIVSEYEKFERLCDSIGGRWFSNYTEGKLDICETAIGGKYTIAKIVYNKEKDELESVKYNLDKILGIEYPVHITINGKDIQDVDEIGGITLKGTGKSSIFVDIRE